MSPLDLDRDFERFREQSDLRALSRVFDAAAPQLLAVARHLAPSRGEAEDLLQATFVVAIERAASWDRARPVLPWLLGILAFEARKARARAGREPDPRRLELRETPEPSAELGRREVRVAVDAALARLPETYAPIVRRHLLDGASPSELAVELGLTPVNARTRLHRGLHLLREAMPRGFAGLGIWFWCHWSGPRTVRGPVLRRAAEHVGRPVPLAYGSLALVALVASAPLAWLATDALDRTPSAPSVETSAAPHDLPAALPLIPLAESERSDPPVFPIARMRPALVRDRVRGRLLLADGSPAIGARIEVALWGPRAEERVPVEIEARSDATGAIDFEFEPRAEHSLRMHTFVEGHAPGRWWFTARDPGSTYDLGVVRLERATELELRVVDAAGEPLGAGWQGIVEVSPLEPGPGLESYFVLEACDLTTGVARFARLPPREVRVAARHPTGHVFPFRPADPTRSPGPLEFIYAGPRPEQRLTITFRPPRGVNRIPAPESVSLTCAHGREHLPTLDPSARSSLVFDGLEDCAHQLSVRDPSFAPLERAGLRPGQAPTQVELSGSATLALSVVDARGELPRGRWKLLFVAESARRSTTEHVWAEGERWPSDGVRLAVVPATTRLRLELEGTLPRDIPLADFQPGETRAVHLELGRLGSSLEGRVLPIQPHSKSDQRVRIVRGERPAHARPGNARVIVAGETLPAAEASLQVESDGTFRFEGLEPGRWTVSTEWGATLGAFVTCDVPQAEPVRLAPPETGTLAGRLLFPDGAHSENVGLMVRELEGERAGLLHGSLEPRRTLEDDGRFLLGAVPTGEVELLLAITDREHGESRTLAWPLTRLRIEPGLQGPIEVDACKVFPGVVTVEVSVDGVRSAGDSVRIVSRPALGPAIESVARVMQSGRAQSELLAMGASLDLEFLSTQRWRVLRTGLLGLRPGEERLETLSLTTCERELLVHLDPALGGHAELELTCLTGSLLAHEPDLNELLQCPVVRPDAAGRARLRLPLGAVRMRAPRGLRCEPEFIEWEHGEAPIELRIVPEELR